MKKATKKVSRPAFLDRPLRSVLNDHPTEELEDETELNHPDEEWEKALLYQSALEEARIGTPTGAFGPGNRRIFEINSILEKLRKQTASMRREFSISGPHPSAVLLQSNPDARRDYFVEHHISKLSREIEQCGKTLILGWLNEDRDLFTTLSNFAQTAFGVRRKRRDQCELGDITITELAIQTAVSLWYAEMGNPSRESVLKALRDKGIKIRPKDQASFFKRCHLAFLENSRGRGRPRKIPQPV